MTKIEGKQVVVTASLDEVFLFLSDLNNFRELLPEDKISGWKSDSGSCSFQVQGGYKIGLRLVSSEPNSKLRLESSSDSPLRFTLDVNLEPSETGTVVSQHCLAELNPFLKMMVEKPLQNLFNFIAERIQKRYSS